MPMTIIPYTNILIMITTSHILSVAIIMAAVSVIIAILGDVAIVIFVIAVFAVVIAILIAFMLNVTKPFMINSVSMITHFHDIVWHCHGDRQYDSSCQYDFPITMIIVVVPVNATVFMRANVYGPITSALAFVNEKPLMSLHHDSSSISL